MPTTTEYLINLPEKLGEFVNEQLATGEFRDANEFFVTLVRAARKKRVEQELLTLVKEANEAGPSVPMTPADWEDIRREVSEGIAQRKEKTRRKP